MHKYTPEFSLVHAFCKHQMPSSSLNSTRISSFFSQSLTCRFLVTLSQSSLSRRFCIALAHEVICSPQNYGLCDAFLTLGRLQFTKASKPQTYGLKNKQTNKTELQVSFLSILEWLLTLRRRYLTYLCLNLIIFFRSSDEVRVPGSPMGRNDCSV